MDNTQPEVQAVDAISTGEESAVLHKIVEDGYNSMSSVYQSLSLRPTSTRVRYIQELVNDLSPGARVLELGCGNGIPTKPFIERGCTVIGADISSAQIELARQNIPEATLIHADMMSLSFPPGSFDAVVAMYSIIHLKPEEQGVIIGRIANWLKPGGYLVCNLPADVEPIGYVGNWLGVKMFWGGLGVDGNRGLMKQYGKRLRVVKDEVVLDKLDDISAESMGAQDETFHWIRAVKEVEGEGY
ncbi:S-adenosyl-L-methionine-dependent methyltransferase [Flammula alnicola]|nr:S-adenosyl-L-methionine-dependent methyltransferase [Flammula alnicola]